MDHNLRKPARMIRSTSPLSYFLAGTILGAAVALAPVFGQEPAAPVSSSNPAGLQPGQRGVVVLTNGRVLSGLLSETGGGYRIDDNGTFATVPFEEVKVTAPTLADAYLRIRETMKNPLAGDHLGVCEWCINNGLWNEAQLEVALALKLEPLRSDARSLAWKIDQHLRSLPAASSQTAVHATAASGSSLQAKEIAPSGLSRELQAEFIRQVQPLVMNKCGNGACHGGNNEREFRLLGNRSSTTNQRLTNDQNLQAILQQIDLANPINSPLITKPAELSGSHRKVFIGSSGNNQRQLLLDWLTKVPAEKKAQQPVTVPRPLPAEITGSTLQPVPGAGPLLSPTPLMTGTAPNPFSENPVKTAAGRTETEPPLNNTQLREILDQRAPDPFDPEVFNRLVHGAM